MKRLHPIHWVLLMAMAAGGGCYTVLRHPEATVAEGETLTGETLTGEAVACSDCHSDYDLYHYTDVYSMGWYAHYPDPWASYYATPWWYENYWAYEPIDPANPGAPAPDGSRRLWPRGSTGGPGFLPVQGGKEVITPATPATSANPDKPDSGEKPAAQPEQKKEKRRLWGR